MHVGELQLNLCWRGDRKHGSRIDGGSVWGETRDMEAELMGEGVCVWRYRTNTGEFSGTNRITCLSVS